MKNHYLITGIENEEDLEDDSAKSEASNDFDDIEYAEELDENDDIDYELQDASDIDLDLDDNDVSDMDFDGDIDDDENIFGDNIPSNKNKQRNKKYEGKSKIKNSKGIDSNIFVSAEKFAEMLEEHSKQKNKHGGTNVFNVTDGANTKQIEWETKRHHKLNGLFNRKKRKGSKMSRKSVKKSKY